MLPGDSTGMYCDAEFETRFSLKYHLNKEIYRWPHPVNKTPQTAKIYKHIFKMDRKQQ